MDFKIRIFVFINPEQMTQEYMISVLVVSTIIIQTKTTNPKMDVTWHANGHNFTHIAYMTDNHSMDFGLFYGTFYVEVGNFSGPKLEGKNKAIYLIFSMKKKRKDFVWKMGIF